MIRVDGIDKIRQAQNLKPVGFGHRMLLEFSLVIKYRVLVLGRLYDVAWTVI